MKNIKAYHAPKYDTATRGLFAKKPGYEQVVEGIYKDTKTDLFVTSLSFELEPEIDEDDEAFLAHFSCMVSDFYEDVPAAAPNIWHQEFASSELENITALRGIIGKRVRCVRTERDGEVHETLVIE